MSQKRFVIVASGRSGSTLLVDLLRSHSDIWCDDELLDTSAWPGIKRPLLWLVRQHPYPYLEFKTRQAGKPVYGFKLKTGGQVPHLADTLKKLHHAGWQMIYLRRADALAQTFSWSVAQASGRWHRRANQTRPPHELPITLDSHRFLQNLSECLRDNRSLAETMPGLPHLAVHYEQDLQNSASWPALSARLCNFLGLELSLLSSTLTKTWQRPYAEIVSNYAEIMAAVAASPLAAQLEQT